MENKLINYLFEKGFLDMDTIIKEYANKDLSLTTYTLLKKIEEDYKSKKD